MKKYAAVEPGAIILAMSLNGLAVAGLFQFLSPG